MAFERELNSHCKIYDTFDLQPPEVTKAKLLFLSEIFFENNFAISKCAYNNNMGIIVFVSSRRNKLHMYIPWILFRNFVLLF